MQLLSPAGSLPAVKSALKQGADAIYIGLKDDTNARHFSGLNFDNKTIGQAAQLIQQQNKLLHIAINTFAHPGQFKRWQYAVDHAVDIGANVLILADIGVLDYAANRYPDIELHLSVQASATTAQGIQFYQNNFGIKRAVLPRVLSIHQVKQLARTTKVELEVFAYGSLCIMAEGRCYLSSYMTGESPNTAGACSPAKYVRWQEDGRYLESLLNDVMIDRYAPDENAGYPTLCKGRFDVGSHTYHALEEPTSLNTLQLLPELINTGISAVKIEGRQRSPAYVAQVTQVWRQAIDACLQNPSDFEVEQSWNTKLAQLSEGSQTTLGAYHRNWQ
ncbi:protease [Saccharobesus litoralis]|uniref:Ubiquinone biosynthesis protein UbiU n=1 Tax=Saccharobesus litoralis TaxID=2172099 RepID=A0A2S0VNJ7_9ALTE|nr:peptidase U32 family protein [Saccharobesus litoralis]AWB65776.1 protease [Saccharobesus litoralis]